MQYIDLEAETQKVPALATVLEFDFLFLIKSWFGTSYKYCQLTLTHHQKTSKLIK
jgi:hypothetical protein